MTRPGQAVDTGQSSMDWTAGDVHLTIRNRGGSVEHYYHFLLGFLVPLLISRADLARTGARRILVRSCGVLDDIVRGTGFADIEILERDTHERLRAEGEGAGLRCVVVEGYDHPDHYAAADFREVAAGLRRRFAHEIGTARDAIAARFGAGEPRIVLIDRGAPDPFYLSEACEKKGAGSQRRSIPNLDAIAAALAGEGMSVVTMRLEGCGLWEQIALFEVADVVIAQHGAALANLIWARPALRVIEILPTDKVSRMESDFFGHLARCMGQRYARVGQAHAHALVDPGEVCKVLREVLDHRASAAGPERAQPAERQAPVATGTVSLEKAMLADVCLGVPLGRLSFEVPAGIEPDADIPHPDTLLFDAEQLRVLRHLYRHDDPVLREGTGALVAAAVEAMSQGPWTVTAKPHVPEGADLHDYVSPAKYWWPNPASPDGLPYVRRDGEVNPECHGDASDYPRLVRFSETVTLLAVAAWVSGRVDFAQRAVELLEIWFVRPGTRQTPHFRFGQFVRGLARPRWQTVIEARHLVQVTEAVILLESLGALDPDAAAAIRDWFGALLDWLCDSEQGREAARADNNIGSWYDLQRVAYAHFCGRQALVGAVVRDGVLPRLSRQVAADGSLPAETARAYPYDYVAFSLVAMAMLARAGERYGLELWGHEEGDGRSFQVAHDWLLRAGRAHQLAAGLTAADAMDVSRTVESRVLGRIAVARERALAAAEAELADLRERLAAEHVRAAEQEERLEARACQAERKLHDIERSRFWRWTGLLRTLVRNLKPGRSLRRMRDWVRTTCATGIGGRIVPGLRSRVARLSGSRESSRNLRALHAARPDDEEGLKRSYRDKGLDREPDTFVLYRVIGNDLHPRHRIGQSRENLRFVLENEPELEDCEKRWVVNRIVDPAEESAIVAMLERNKQPYLHIPFDAAEFRTIGLDRDCLPEPGFLEGEAAMRLEPELRMRAQAAVNRLRNNYVMNNNGARNAALRDGRDRAKWVLPWDGNCFVTRKAWEEIRTAVRLRPHLPYFVVPMARATDNAALLDAHFAPEPIEEPQVLFRRDASAEFDERFCYGRRPKVELFWRLGVPGPWDRWSDDPWDQPRNPVHTEARQFGVAGWVARMFSGMKTLEYGDRKSFKARGVARLDGILATLRYVDRITAFEERAGLGLTVYRRDDLQSLRRHLAVAPDSPAAQLARTLIADADGALERGPYSVVDKTTLPPSGDARDYWHPAPYWWPDPARPDGLPYVWRDGERVPGTRMYEPESERYDRTRLQRLFDDTTVLALAWAVGERREHVEHAARLVQAWFVDPSTRMNPHLDYAQVRMGHNGNLGASTGIIEFKDLHYFLDAVRIIECAGVLGDRARMAFRSWLWNYLQWLRTSPQGLKECRARNNHGTCFDLQVAAIAAYLGETPVLDEVVARAGVRLVQQFAADGSQPEELRRNTTAHYCCFNLQAWLNLADLAGSRGVDLWRHGEGGGVLARGASWLLSHEGKPWPFEQIDAFDTDRYLPIRLAAQRAGIEVPAAVDPGRFERVKARFFPHDGIRPYWNIPGTLGTTEIAQGSAYSAPPVSGG